MNNIKKKHKVTALLLLTVIISHLLIFHNEFEEKVLCIGDGDHFHIENINDSHLENQKKVLYENNKETLRTNNNCEDYLLDKHVDEDFAKVRKNQLNNIVEISTLDPIIFLNSNVVNRLNHRINSIQKHTLELLPTVILLI